MADLVRKWEYSATLSKLSPCNHCRQLYDVHINQQCPLQPTDFKPAPPCQEYFTFDGKHWRPRLVEMLNG